MLLLAHRGQARPHKKLLQPRCSTGWGGRRVGLHCHWAFFSGHARVHGGTLAHTGSVCFGRLTRTDLGISAVHLSDPPAYV